MMLVCLVLGNNRLTGNKDKIKDYVNNHNYLTNLTSTIQQELCPYKTTSPNKNLRPLGAALLYLT